MNTPPFLSPMGQRFSFMNPRTPRTSRSPILSPTRIRPMDSLLADLSPATTFEAFTSNSGTLKKSIEAASPEERAFGIRAAHASQKIEEWVKELSEWSWPEAGSTGFELPISKRRVSRENEKINEDQTGGSDGASQIEEPEQPEEEYWGSLPVQSILQYESRIEEITEDMEDLEVEDIKRQVLETHIMPKSRPSSSHDPQPAASIYTYTKMDDFTAVVTATVLQALPNLARLMGLMDVWSVRIIVLRNIQPVLMALQDMEIAMKSAWSAIEKPDGAHATNQDQSYPSRETFDAIRNVLQKKVGTLGQQLDSLLDTLEGREDTVPDSWLDRMEVIEEDYSNWTVYGDQKVLEGEWEAQKKRLAVTEPVLDVFETNIRQGEESIRQDLETPPGDTVQSGSTLKVNRDKIPTFTTTPPTASTDAFNETMIEKSTNATLSHSTQSPVNSGSGTTPAVPFVLKRPLSVETNFKLWDDQVNLPDTPSRNPKEDVGQRFTTKTPMASPNFTTVEKKLDAETFGLGILVNSSESDECSSDDIEGTNSMEDELVKNSSNQDAMMAKEKNSPFFTHTEVQKEPHMSTEQANDHVLNQNNVQEISEAKFTPHAKQSVESLHSKFGGVKELPTPPEVEGTPQVNTSSLSTNLPTTISANSQNNASDPSEYRRETPPPSLVSSIVGDMDDEMEAKAATPSDTPADDVHTPPRSGFGVERPSTPRTPSSVGSATSHAIRSPSNQPRSYTKDKYLEDGGTPRSPTKRPMHSQGTALGFGCPSPERNTVSREAVYDASQSHRFSPTRQSPVLSSVQAQYSDPPGDPRNILAPVELECGEGREVDPQITTPKPTRIRSPSYPQELSGYHTSESSPEVLEVEPARYFKPVLSPINSPRHFGGEFDGAAPTKQAPIPLDDFAGFSDIKTNGSSPGQSLSAPKSKSPEAFEPSDRDASENPSPVKSDGLRALEFSDFENYSAEDTDEETPVFDSTRRASVLSFGKMSRASLKTISRPSSSGSGTPITPSKKAFEESFMTPIRAGNQDDSVNSPVSTTAQTPSIVTTDTSDLEMSPPSERDKLSKDSRKVPLKLSHSVVSAMQKDGKSLEKDSAKYLGTPSPGHTPRHRSVSMVTPKSSGMQDSPRTDPGTPPAEINPKEPPHLKNVAISNTPPVRSPAKTSHDQFHEQITQVLQNIPAQIRLTAQPKNSKSDLQVVKKRPSVMSLTDGRRPLTRPSSPSFTLAPANNRRPRTSNGAPEIKLYHLSRSTGEAPIKLFVRLVGEHGERVMVRVGGGWADLGEYLKEYASHHRRADRESKVEVQDLSPRSVSRGSAHSSPPQRPATSMGRASSRLGSRPPSSLERPMPTLTHRRSRLSLGEESRDSPRTPSVMSTRRNETPPSVGSNSRPSSRASMTNWADEDGSLGLAGPKSKRIDITEEDERWIESMKEKVRQASAQKEKSFGDIGKAGGTKRMYRKGI